jgi:hypothetical protein
MSVMLLMASDGVRVSLLLVSAKKTGVGGMCCGMVNVVGRE